MIRWSACQFIAIFVLVAAAVVMVGTFTRGIFWSAPLVVLLYALHWRFQGVAYRLDWLRSARLVSMIKSQPLAEDPTW